MKIAFSLKNIPFKKYLIISLSANFIFILLCLIAQLFLPPEIPLFYGLPEGKEQLAPTLSLIIPSAFSLILSFFNLLIAALLKDEFLRKALVVVSIAVFFLSLITTVKIFFLVGSF